MQSVCFFKEVYRHLVTSTTSDQRGLSVYLVESSVLLFTFLDGSNLFATCRCLHANLFNDWRLGVRRRASERRHTCSLCSFQGLAALLSHHGVDVDKVFGQRVEALEDHCDDCAIYEHLITERTVRRSATIRVLVEYDQWPMVSLAAVLSLYWNDSSIL